MVIVNTTYTFDESNLINLSKAKAHLRVTHNLDDVEIAAMINAAYLTVENHLNRVLLNSAVKYQIKGSNSGFSLPLPELAPFSSFGAVTAIDDEGVTHSPSNTMPLNIKLDGNNVDVNDIEFATDVTVNHWQMVINYQPKILNEAINAAVLLTLSHYYENRGSVVVGTVANVLPMGVKAILSPYRYLPV